MDLDDPVVDHTGRVVEIDVAEFVGDIASLTNFRRQVVVNSQLTYPPIKHSYRMEALARSCQPKPGDDFIAKPRDTNHSHREPSSHCEGVEPV